MTDRPDILGLLKKLSRSKWLADTDGEIQAAIAYLENAQIDAELESGEYTDYDTIEEMFADIRETPPPGDECGCVPIQSSQPWNFAPDLDRRRCRYDPVLEKEQLHFAYEAGQRVRVLEAALEHWIIDITVSSTPQRTIQKIAQEMSQTLAQGAQDDRNLS